MIKCRTLKSDRDSSYLVQVQVDDRDVIAAIHPSHLMDEIRVSLADKIAQHLFTAIEPAIIESLKTLNPSPASEHD